MLVYWCYYKVIMGFYLFIYFLYLSGEVYTWMVFYSLNLKHKSLPSSHFFMICYKGNSLALDPNDIYIPVDWVILDRD